MSDNFDMDGFYQLFPSRHRKPSLGKFLLTCFIFIGAAVIMTLKCFGAPISFPKQTKVERITTTTFIGDWTMCWGDTRYPISLKDSGTYRCKFGAVTYVGSWGLDNRGRFWITESSRPQESSAWRNYVVKLKSGTLEGVIEVGAPGVSFKLERRGKCHVSPSPVGNKASLIPVERLKMPRGDD
jgi:hypothetical protein